jgi:hypothetical protein
VILKSPDFSAGTSSRARLFRLSIEQNDISICFTNKEVSARKWIGAASAALSPLENSALSGIDRIFRLDVSSDIIYIYGVAEIIGWA